MPCDQCGQSKVDDETNPMVYFCQPRPSDPAEMCCTLAGHKNCFRVEEIPSICESGGVATAKQWNEWFENGEAGKAGFLWLSL